MKLEFESNTAALPYVSDHLIKTVNSESSPARVSQMLQAGIKAAQDGNRSEARPLLLQVTEIEPKNETAWLWMASISEYPEELIIFLNNVLNINPQNARAVEWMRATKSLLAKTFVGRGAEAMEEANKDFARQCFLQAIVHDECNETAWESLASLTDSVEEKISHLQRVLNINPNNKSAKAALQTAKAQNVEAALQKANRAAISGEREAAREMLQEVLKDSPDLEEAWILKSYLAESFSEKITCFERVLSFNPENEMAISGLASLRAMMAKNENKKAEQAAILAEAEAAAAAAVEVETATTSEAETETTSEAETETTSEEETMITVEAEAEEVLILTEDQYVFAVVDEEDDNPTRKLELPIDLALAQYSSEVAANETANQPNQAAEFSNPADADRDYDNIYTEPEKISAPPSAVEYTLEKQASVLNDYSNYQTTNDQFSAPVKLAENDYAPNFERAETNSSTEESAPNKEETASAAPAPENQIRQIFSKPLTETAACPFCAAGNEPNAYVCHSCRAVLTLSDLEMLLAYTEADRETLRQAVEKMETERKSRPLSAKELKNLAIGHINLKDLRAAVKNLQKAAQMNPNDVMLGSQINFLRIRLAEIEQQEMAQSSMVTGRKILVVDDSATVRKLISSKLEKSGHEVVCAVDGIDALEKIKEYTPDLILLDIMMPQLDGYQVCKMIRNNEATKNIPIVMISGKDGFFDKVRGRMAGTSGYITKPFGPETLMKAVETYIAHRDETSVESEDEAGAENCEVTTEV